MKGKGDWNMAIVGMKKQENSEREREREGGGRERTKNIHILVYLTFSIIVRKRNTNHKTLL